MANRRIVTATPAATANNEDSKTNKKPRKGMESIDSIPFEQACEMIVDAGGDHTDMPAVVTRGKRVDIFTKKDDDGQTVWIISVYGSQKKRSRFYLEQAPVDESLSLSNPNLTILKTFINRKITKNDHQ
jgi:hypothetical protein